MDFNTNFIWTDLSTYDVVKAQRFYTTTFGWQFKNTVMIAEEVYALAHVEENYVAGMYALPDAFHLRRFPSFWMPYIHVESIASVEEKVKSFAYGKVEIPSTILPDGSIISLIRDPLGAGFTVFEGPSYDQPYDGHGACVGFELHVSNMDEVQPFYQAVFGWHFERDELDKDVIFYSERGETLGHFRHYPETFRGGYEYWIPIFQVTDMVSYLKGVQSANGQISYALNKGMYLVQDSQEAAFIVRSSTKRS